MRVTHRAGFQLGAQSYPFVRGWGLLYCEGRRGTKRLTATSNTSLPRSPVPVNQGSRGKTEQSRPTRQPGATILKDPPAQEASGLVDESSGETRKWEDSVPSRGPRVFI